MINVTLPEIILLETIQAAIAFVRADYNNQIDKTKTYLHILLNGAALEQYNLYEQAVQVICGDEGSPRLFKVDLMFNRSRDNFPTAHITLPSEQTGTGNGMGMDEGYADYLDETPEENLTSTILRPVFSRRMSATYNIVIMSDNSNEVILLYHFMRAVMVALIPHLHIKGLSNVTFGGQDLQPYSETAHNIHMRAITMNLQYDTFVPSIFTTELFKDLFIDGKTISGEVIL